MSLNHDECWDLLRSAEHGVLCTTNAQRAIDAVPVCYAVVGDLVVSPVDRVKPKTTTALKRSENLWRHPAATLLCEHWDADDWSQLWWVRVRLSFNPEPSTDVAVMEDALRDKYPHYRDETFADLLVFEVRGLLGWSATAG